MQCMQGHFCLAMHCLAQKPGMLEVCLGYAWGMLGSFQEGRMEVFHVTSTMGPSDLKLSPIL